MTLRNYEENLFSTKILKNKKGNTSIRIMPLHLFLSGESLFLVPVGPSHVLGVVALDRISPLAGFAVEPRNKC